MPEQNIIWRPIVGFNGKYLVSNTGQVKSTIRGNIFKNQVQQPGYCRIVLYLDKKPYTSQVHRLVAQAFISNPENKKEVNHKNGCKTDNRVENLEWCTASENQKHAYKYLGRIPQTGEKCGHAKFTNNQVALIRKEHAPGNFSIKDLCLKYPISYCGMRNIVNYTTYRF